MLPQSEVMIPAPFTKKYVLNTTSIQKLLTAVILNRAQLTNIELGLIGHSAYYDVKTKKKDIISKFKLSTIAEFSSKYGASDIMSFPKLDALADVLFIKEEGIVIYDMDEKKDEIYFRWHTNLAIAAMCNISLAAPVVKFDYLPIISPSKKDVKNKEVKQKVPMVVSLEVSYDYDAPYTTDAVHKFLKDNNLI